MLGGYTPSIGDSFDVLTFTGSRTGTFSDINFPSLSNIGLSIGYASNAVILTTTLLGDLNTDGFIGIEDLNTVLSNWNQDVIAGVWTTGDPSGDGFVGIEDLNAVLGNWNAGKPPSDTTNIPEPASAAMIVMGAPLLLRRRRL